MKLSIIVPVYNMASDDKLTWCMDSLVGQTVTDYEIIAVDDKSTDESYSILKDYESRYPDLVRVYQCPVNLHQGGAKNIGMEHAAGEWIGFMDADDWVTPDCYERMLKLAEETGADMVGCDYCLVDKHTYEQTAGTHNNDASQTGILDEDKYKSLILNTGSLVVKLYKREIVIDCSSRFPEHIFYEDNALAATWVLRAKHFEYIDEPLYFYYQHDSSTVHTISMQRLDDRMSAARIMVDEALKGGYYLRFHEEIEYLFARLFYMNTLMSYMIAVRPRHLKWIRKLGNEMREQFPKFTENRYFVEKVHPEEQKWARIQQKSTTVFMLIYCLKEAYRKHRYK